MNDGRRGIVENIPLPAQTSVSVSTGAVSSGAEGNGPVCSRLGGWERAGVIGQRREKLQGLT